MKIFVVLSAAGIAVSLTLATWGLNFVGSDAQMLYLPATRQMPYVHYPSELCHSYAFDNPQLLHGKEVAIWHFSLMQRLLNDFDSVRPFLWTMILAFTASAVLVFFVCRFYWGEKAGLVCYLLFITSFWPYVYVLLVKHQPLGLMYFLSAVLALQQRRGNDQMARWWCGASGLLMAVALQASTVSVLYLPFYLAAVYERHQGRQLARNHLLFMAFGFALAVYYLNYPHVVGNIREFLGYVGTSRGINHFSFHQNILRGWISQPAAAFGGWEWVFKYLWLAMPVLFPIYMVCAMCILRRHWPMVFLSFLPVVLAECSHVAQYGGNYFPCFIGVLILLGYSCRTTSTPGVAVVRRSDLLWILLVIHIIVNLFILYNDVYLPRMASVFLSREIRHRHLMQIDELKDNALNEYLIAKIAPDVLRKIRIKDINNIYQDPDGVIAVAPVVGSSIYLAMTHRFSAFDPDIYLNELFRKNVVSKYALASFKTMASSRIWRQEEEMLSYRDLILGQFPYEGTPQTRLWLLDGRRLYQDRLINKPCPEYTAMVEFGIRNIGTKSDLYRYRGLMVRLDTTLTLSQLPMRLFKTGVPDDQLVMYVYRHWFLTPQKSVMGWTGGWASVPIDGEGITAFKFDPPLVLPPGLYDFVIYRTGKDSDRDFYRVYIDEPEKAEYIRRLSFPAGL